MHRMNTSARRSLVSGLLGLVMCVAGPTVDAQTGAANGEWRSYGGDLGSTKYSPLDQIDAANFSDLRIAWRWQSADGSLDLETLRGRFSDRTSRAVPTGPVRRSIRRLASCMCRRRTASP